LPGGRLGRLANQVSVCEDCERSTFGIISVRRPPCAMELVTDYNA
jgi:fumarylacetoacetate (FAA) hydrolase family protein